VDKKTLRAIITANTDPSLKIYQ